MDESCSVVVIGAGFAGVTAARDLSQAGHSVIVLEARDRIGGRTYADDGIGRRVELGGAYCHWTQADIWREVRRYGLELGGPDLSERIVYHADGELHTTDLEGADAGLAPGMDAFFGDALEYFPLPWNLDAVDYTKVDEETIAERIAGLDVTEAERDFFDGAISYGIAWPKEAAVSHLIRWVANYSGNWRATFEAGSYWRIASGTKSLLDAMVADSDADFRLSTPAAAVEDTGDGVVVTTRSGDTVRAGAVIVAVPLNTMSTIEFSPGLREPTRQLIEQGNPMLSRKFWARVKGEKGFTGYAPLGVNPITNALAEYSLEGDTLFACFGPAGPGHDFDQTDVGAVQEALRFWDPEVEVVAVDGHDWVEDEFSQGTWMMFRPGQMKNLLPDIQKPHGRITFAGGDIAPLFPGWIQGAIESGAVSAASVDKQLSGSLSPAAS